MERCFSHPARKLNAKAKTNPNTDIRPAINSDTQLIPPASSSCSSAWLMNALIS